MATPKAKQQAVAKLATQKAKTQQAAAKAKSAAPKQPTANAIKQHMQKVQAFTSNITDPAAEQRAVQSLSPENQKQFQTYLTARNKAGYKTVTVADWMKKSGAVAATAGTPGSAGEANQSLATSLTPDQSLDLYGRMSAGKDAYDEADRSDQEAQAETARALSEVNRTRALQAQSATDDLIARGMLQSGTAAGQLSDIDLAASKQTEHLNAALASTTLRNIGVRQNVLADQAAVSMAAHRQAQMNIADGTVPGRLGETEATPGTAAVTGRAIAAPKPKAPAKKAVSPAAQQAAAAKAANQRAKQQAAASKVASKPRTR